MFEDGMYRVIAVDQIKKPLRGNVRVRVWFSFDAKPRFGVWGVAPTYEDAVLNAVENFAKQRHVDKGRMATVAKFPEATYEVEARKIKKLSGKLLVPKRYAKRI